jgi:hypothetical protein
MESVTLTVKLYAPAADNVPDRVPPDDRLVPDGIDPEITDQV